METLYPPLPWPLGQSSMPGWVSAHTHIHTHKVTEVLSPEKSGGLQPGRGWARSYHVIRHIHQLHWAENWNGNVGLERLWLPFTSRPKLMICHFSQGQSCCPRSHTPTAAEHLPASPASALLPAALRRLGVLKPRDWSSRRASLVPRWSNRSVGCNRFQGRFSCFPVVHLAVTHVSALPNVMMFTWAAGRFWTVFALICPVTGLQQGINRIIEDGCWIFQCSHQSVGVWA